MKTKRRKIKLGKYFHKTKSTNTILLTKFEKNSKKLSGPKGRKGWTGKKYG